MSSAFKTFMSAAGVGSACYLLATATWGQVLMLFLAASLGWCLFAIIASKHKANPAAQFTKKISKKTAPVVVAQAMPAPPPNPNEPPRKVYKFPIHQLAGATIPRTVQALET